MTTTTEITEVPTAPVDLRPDLGRGCPSYRRRKIV